MKNERSYVEKNCVCFWKVHKKQFLMGLKFVSDIRRPSLATRCWRRSWKFITVRVISGGMVSISCRILSFKSSRDRERCLKTFSFRYPQRKNSHGLKSGDRASHPTSPLKEIKRPGNISLNTPSKWFLKPIKSCFLCTFQKYIQFFF